MNRWKRMCAALAAAALLAGLTACQSGSVTDNANTYVQGLLDASYLGEISTDYLKVTEYAGREAAEADYESYMAQEAEDLLSYLIVSKPTQAVTQRAQEVIRAIYSHAQYTVAPAEELEYHYNIALEWVPEGFELEGGIEGGSDLVSYLSPVDGLLEVSVTPYSQSSVYNLNTEGCTKQEITVQGHPAELYVTGEEMLQKRFSMTGFDIWSDMMIYWIDENNRVIVQISFSKFLDQFGTSPDHQWHSQ